MGTGAWGITVDRYKDRWSASLKHGWDGQSLQPEGHFNAPHDATDAQLKELTVEVKRQKIQKTTGKIEGFEWHRPSGSANELWDLLVYGNAALDADRATLRDSLESTYNLISTLSNRLGCGGVTRVVPGF
jgi:phage terminase large subunit GpA-like protein